MMTNITNDRINIFPLRLLITCHHDCRDQKIPFFLLLGLLCFSTLTQIYYQLNTTEVTSALYKQSPSPWQQTQTETEASHQTVSGNSAPSITKAVPQSFIYNQLIYISHTNNNINQKYLNSTRSTENCSQALYNLTNIHIKMYKLRNK